MEFCMTLAAIRVCHKGAVILTAVSKTDRPGHTRGALRAHLSSPCDRNKADRPAQQRHHNIDVSIKGANRAAPCEARRYVLAGSSEMDYKLCGAMVAQAVR
jgi:hypothetical protein